MTRSMIYRDPMGPDVRIGVLQHQDALRMDRLGRYALRHPSGAVLGKINPEDGEIEIRAIEARPARMGWRLVLAKKESPAQAAAWIETDGRKRKGLTLEALQVGTDFQSGPSPVTAKEWWIVSQVFENGAAADEARRMQTHPDLIALLEVRLEPPTGMVEVRIGGREPLRLPGFVRIEPVDEGPHRVILKDVIVGVGFHWQHLEDQKLRGALEARIDNKGKLTAVNELPIEQYLFSVNSSEMMSQCPQALLEAQTIAARNTILATMDKHHHADDFDICADDHCQCYRGSSREADLSRQAVLNTLGEVLVHNKRVCDCRYSKMCGGISEDADSVWDGDRVPYMLAVWDGEKKDGDEARTLMPAESEARAKALIEARPDVFCNTLTSTDVPQYLRYSAEYFRWTVEFTREEFEASLARFPHYRIGELKDMEVLSRGKSGRIEAIRLIGSERTTVIHREYYIREAFAPFFLYSACFIPTLERDAAGRVTRVILKGGGWGHGAGLCQIGASMMAERGKSCGEILMHYFVGTSIDRLFGRGGDYQAILESERAIGDLRGGDRCYEYYNCYRAARCPVYQQRIDLRAELGAGASGDNATDNVRFVQKTPGRKAVDLETMKIDCEFLNFTGPTGSPKPGVK